MLVVAIHEKPQDHTKCMLSLRRQINNTDRHHYEDPTSSTGIHPPNVVAVLRFSLSRITFLKLATQVCNARPRRHGLAMPIKAHPCG